MLMGQLKDFWDNLFGGFLGKVEGEKNWHSNCGFPLVGLEKMEDFIDAFLRDFIWLFFYVFGFEWIMIF
jgi:hypothetical protein